MRGIFQWIPVISMAIFGGLSLYFRSFIPGTGQAENLIYYFNLALGPIKSFAIWLAVIILMSFNIYLAWVFIKFSLKFGNLLILMPQASRYFFSFLKKQAGSFWKYAVPSVLSLIFLSFVLGSINQINSINLKDDFLMDIDFFLTGVFPPLYLFSVFPQDWLAAIIIFSFKNLSLILIAVSVFLFLKNKPELKKFSVSFCLALLFMMPLWLAFPALSPHDRFIDNVYSLPISAEISLDVAKYNPEGFLKQFLSEMRSKKESSLPYLPTSTMPSAHVAWAVLISYYLFKTKILVGVIVLPFLIFSSFGTVFLAQHYFIDILGGIAIAIPAIVLARRGGFSILPA